MKEFDEPMLLSKKDIIDVRLDEDTIDLLNVLALSYTLFLTSVQGLYISKQCDGGWGSFQLSIYKKKETNSERGDSLCIWEVQLEENNSTRKDVCGVDSDKLEVVISTSPMAEESLLSHFIEITHQFNTSFHTKLIDSLMVNYIETIGDIYGKSPKRGIHIYVRKEFQSFYGLELLKVMGEVVSPNPYLNGQRVFNEVYQRSLFKMDGLLYTLFDWVMDMRPVNYLSDIMVLEYEFAAMTFAKGSMKSVRDPLMDYKRDSKSPIDMKSYEYCVNCSPSELLKDLLDGICRSVSREVGSLANVVEQFHKIEHRINSLGCFECSYFTSPFNDKNRIHQKRHLGGEKYHPYYKEHQFSVDVDMVSKEGRENDINDGDDISVDENGRILHTNQPLNKKLKTTKGFEQKDEMSSFHSNDDDNGCINLNNGSTERYKEMLNFTKHFKNDGRCCQCVQDEVVVVAERTVWALLHKDNQGVAVEKKALKLSEKVIKSYPFDSKVSDYELINTSCTSFRSLKDHVAYTQLIK